MYSRQFRPRLVACEVKGGEGQLDCNAKLSEDGKSLVCSVVNLFDQAMATTIRVSGFESRQTVAAVTQLSAALDAVNTESNQFKIAPESRAWEYGSLEEGAELSIAPNSVTTIVFE